jgi:hypothetical protein
MRALTGSIRTTLVGGILPVSGKAVAATSPMTIAGTEADSGTNVATLAVTRAETTAARRTARNEGLSGVFLVPDHASAGIVDEIDVALKEAHCVW